MHGLVIDDFVSEHGAGTYYFTAELVLSEPNVRSGELPVGEIILQ